MSCSCDSDGIISSNYVQMHASSTPRLTQFAYTSKSWTKYSLSRSKWSCPSLPLLISLPLTSLRLTRLSQAGSRALSTLLSSLSEYSSLDHLSIDFIFLDDQLCERIVEAGRRLRRLKIGTSGTKLTDKGICILLEGCDLLEELFLEDVQGKSIDSPPALFLCCCILRLNLYQVDWAVRFGLDRLNIQPALNALKSS